MTATKPRGSILENIKAGLIKSAGKFVLKVSAFFKSGSLISFVMPVIFILAMLKVLSFVKYFSFDADEGINAIKCMLVDHGYKLYYQIWSDQPPLFTHAAALVFNVFGFDINAGRISVLIMSGLLLWCAWVFIELSAGRKAALIGLFLIVLSPNYARLSISFMIGLPSLALAMFSLYVLAIWHKNNSYTALVCSALLLGLSLATKLFTGILIPIMAAGILIESISRSTGLRRYLPFILWLGTLMVSLAVLLACFYGAPVFEQLINTHLVSSKLRTVNEARPLPPLGLLGNAVLSVLFIIRKKNWLLIYLVAWVGMACGVLYFHNPLWYHQALLITVPAAMLSGYLLAELMTLTGRITKAEPVVTGSKALITMLMVVSVINIVSDISRTFKPGGYNTGTDNFIGTSSVPHPVVLHLRRYAPVTRQVFIDAPLYAFMAGTDIMPEYAVLSRKRLSLMKDPARKIFDSIERSRPEQILLSRYVLPVDTLKAFEKDYRVEYRDNKNILLIRKDIPKRTEQCNTPL